MSYLGQAPSDAILTGSQIPDDIITTPKIADSAVTNPKLANDSITINGSATALGGSATIATGIDWQAVVTGATLTAVAGNGYPIDTTLNACTVTLPASASVGDEIIFSDYARRWGSNALTINQNSLNYQGNTTPNPVYDTSGESVHIVYQDATKGWVPTSDGAVAYETGQTYTAEWLMIAGGGGGATSNSSGGGGAGGYRNAYASETSGGGGATETVATFVGGTLYTIDVGAGGAADTNGSDSSISGDAFTTLTATGGGTGGIRSDTVSDHTGKNGGSGGGGGSTTGDGTTCSGGSGTSNQGYAGGSGEHVGGSHEGGGAGGGASAVGANNSGATGGAGGAGLASSITTASVTRGGGGGGSGNNQGGGGSGGGGAAGNNSGTAGTANTGGGGGSGNASGGSGTGGAGGSGVVILRMLDANYSGSTTGSPTVATGQGGSANETILTFNGDGTYTG